jgi:glutamate/tyrosine decarboxylase-like PLP-dependent enzyme
MTTSAGDSLDWNDLLNALDAAQDHARSFLSGLPARPVALPVSDMQLAALDEPLPEEGADADRVLIDWLLRSEPGIVGSAGPRFFGYVVGGVTPAALGGDVLASALDQSGGIWAASPAAAQTEMVVLRWLKELFDLPASWHGVMTNGATTANAIGLAAARQWAGARLGFDPVQDGLSGYPAIPVIAGETVHASVVKALGTLGFGRRSLRMIPASDGRIDTAALAVAMRSIDGPVVLVGTAGEVNTGQIDDLAAMADLRAAHPGGAWLHVDAAFGLFAALSPALRDRLSSIDRADSVASDAHKWLNVPYDSGFAFVRDGELLRSAFAISSAYLTGGGEWDADDYSPEMSRRFRALPAWCALKGLGRSGYRALVERCVGHAAAFASWVDSTPGFELMNRQRMAETPLNIVCFRAVDDGLADEDLDAANREMAAWINADGRVFISRTVWHGRAALRVAFVNWATTGDDVMVLQQAIIDARLAVFAAPQR